MTNGSSRVLSSLIYPTVIAVAFGLFALLRSSGVSLIISTYVPVLATAFFTACVSVALIGQPALAPTLLFTIVFIAGFCIVGAQAAVNALSASYYPTDLRSTGVGAGLGVGRVGGIIGPPGTAVRQFPLDTSLVQTFFARPRFC